ncbi:TetR/AcrR family transcriptional regulator [Aquabacter spiritensis]|uniref:TetR family transcriptional regulator n=1 Tax=Aquabacter spiritensis TaxID=933073 RepID=A0A4R3M1W1_9HYPH|nr:TetR/AcrR family transcriptional regulator [Aquabacter spiritensis]TCT06713.1 TetR family transcriptional regulator [Aquabacter spiritensis]
MNRSEDTTAIPAADDPSGRLLDAAERLFAERGFNGVSVRTITAEAGVNLASAHYYYRTKLSLFRAVFERRVLPMNAERLARLEKAWPDRSLAPDLREVLEAFIGPTIIVSSEAGETFRRLSGLSSTDPAPEVRETVFGLYDEVAPLFVAALRKIRPDLGERDLLWRLKCIFGAMMFVRADNGRPEQLVGLPHAPVDAEEAMRHLIPYLASIFELPPVAPTKRRRK